MATLPIASHRRSTAARVWTRGAATVSMFTTRMVKLPFNIAQGRCKTAVDTCENEGGCGAADTAPGPRSVNAETEAR
jgi:hypothetical protein